MRWTAGYLLLAMLLLGSGLRAEGITRYARFSHGGEIQNGILEGATIHVISGSPFGKYRRTGRTLALDAVKLVAPTQPSKVLAVALNFQSHAGSSGAARPELFAKLPSALTGHESAIVLPPGADNLHYEGELVVVIGKRAKNVSETEAANYVFAVSAGNWQFSDLQWLRAKASDSFAPVGPIMVRGLDYRDLLITTRLNGEVRQSESSRHLIHGVDAIVSFASRFITLEAGDLIFCGTPGRTRSMQPGDVIEVEIEGVGVLRNRVVAGSP